LLTSSDVPEDRVRVLAPRLIALAQTAASPIEEVISKLVLLKNSDALGR
jgi:hypothetical protein